LKKAEFLDVEKKTKTEKHKDKYYIKQQIMNIITSLMTRKPKLNTPALPMVNPTTTITAQSKYFQYIDIYFCKLISCFIF
jgi:hypothetical protein